MSRQDPSPISGRLAILLTAVALVSFSAVMVLAGWAPEMRERDQAGAHPYSTSALGYNGLYRLLGKLDYPVRISRMERELEQRSGGLMIITLSSGSDLSILDDKALLHPTLLVLPKWNGRTDGFDASRYSDTFFLEARSLNDRVSAAWSGAEIVRTRTGEKVDTPFGLMPVRPDIRLQLLRSDELEPIAMTSRGILLGYDPRHDVYILSDPDILNTFGLARPENVAFAIAVIDLLRSGEDDPVILDASTHGFARSDNLLKMMFSIPFLGATLIAAAGALMMGWAGAVRFGPPLREPRSIPGGKQALVDNSAGLVTMARRETRMAPLYAAIIRKRLARALGLGRSEDEDQLTGMLDRLGPIPGESASFQELESALNDTQSGREQLIRNARALHHRRSEIMKRILK